MANTFLFAMFAEFANVCILVLPGYSTTCYILNQHGQWIEDQYAKVNPGRGYSGTVVIQNQLFMVGGKSETNSRLDRILALKTNTTTVKWNSRLDHGLSSACVVPWTKTTFLVTGGNAGRVGQYEDKTYFVNIETKRVYEGPVMHNARSGHGCTEIMVKGQAYVMVVGGYDAEKSTEMLKKGVMTKWTKGEQKSNTGGPANSRAS